MDIIDRSRRLLAGSLRYMGRSRNSGAIEGVLHIDGAPAPAGEWVACDYIVPHKDGSFSSDDSRTKTRSGGRFRFPRVPAGEAGLGRCPCDIDGCRNDVERRVEVRTGETTVVELGRGVGRIKGRFSFPEGLAETPVWGSVPSIWMECLGPHPDHLEGRLIEYSGSWRRSFCSSDTWKNDDLRWYHVPVNDDGTFEVSGIHPGYYGLKIEVDEQVDVGLFGPSTIGFHMIAMAGAALEFQDLGTLVLPRAALVERGTGRLDGRLLFDGEPAPSGTPVKCEITVDWHDEYQEERLRGFWSIGWDDLLVETDSAGHFSFRDVPAGSARVCVATDGDGEELGGESQTQIVKGETVFITVSVTKDA